MRRSRAFIDGDPAGVGSGHIDDPVKDQSPGTIQHHDIGRPEGLAQDQDVAIVHHGDIRNGRIAHSHILGRAGQSDPDSPIHGDGQGLGMGRRCKQKNSEKGQGRATHGRLRISRMNQALRIVGIGQQSLKAGRWMALSTEW